LDSARWVGFMPENKPSRHWRLRVSGGGYMWGDRCVPLLLLR
jgi:hypothetical protein